MLGKIYFYPSNEASGKVNLVSPLVIINVTRISATFFQKKKTQCNKKIENETFNSILTVKNQEWI